MTNITTIMSQHIPFCVNKKWDKNETNRSCMKLSALTVLFIRNGKHKMKSKGKSKMCNSETHATMACNNGQNIERNRKYNTDN